MTKTKTLLLAGSLVLVLTGASVAVKLIFFPSVPDKFFQARNAAALQHAPPGLVIVRPTHFPKPPANSTSAALVKGTLWMVGRNMTFQMLMATAYSYNPERIVLPTGAPTQNFDFLVTTAGDPREHLQSAIRKKLGFTAGKEIRDVPVFVLKVVNPNSDGLKISRDDEKQNSEVKNGRLYDTHMKLSVVTDEVTRILKMPVVDKTGLTNFYDFSLAWDAKTSQAIQSGTLDMETGKKILAEWGLGLESDTAPLEMLVVKKAR